MANRAPDIVTAEEMAELVAFLKNRTTQLNALAMRMRDENLKLSVQNMGGVTRWRKSLDGLIRNLKRELGEV